MRRKRNDSFYGIAIISDVEAKDAVRAAEELLKLLTADIDNRFPDHRRWYGRSRAFQAPEIDMQSGDGLQARALRSQPAQNHPKNFPPFCR